MFAVQDALTGPWGVAGLLVTSLTSVVIMLITQRQQKKSNAKVETKLDTAAGAVEQINVAVNHVQPGEPTLVATVKAMDKKLDANVELTQQTAQNTATILRLVAALDQRVSSLEHPPHAP